MPILRSTARRLVSDTEFRLVNESFKPLVNELSDKALLQRMERARKARDRYHSMVERQQNKASSATQRGSASSANLKDTMSKEKIFEETLARFERQTAKLGDRAGTQGAAPRKSAAKTVTKGASSRQSTTGTSAKQPSIAKAKAAASKSGGMKEGIKGGVNRPAQSEMGKKPGGKGGAQATSKASVKMTKKAAAKSGNKTAAAKVGKGTGGATKNTPRGRRQGATATTTLH